MTGIFCASVKSRKESWYRAPKLHSVPSSGSDAMPDIEACEDDSVQTHDMNGNGANQEFRSGGRIPDGPSQNPVPTSEGSSENSRSTSASVKLNFLSIIRSLGSSLWLKLSISVGFLVLVTSGILALIVWVRSRRELVQGIELRLTTIATLKAEQLESYVNGERAKFGLIASRVLMRNLMNQHNLYHNLSAADVLRGQQDLQEATSSLPEFISVIAVDLDLQVVFSTSSLDVSESFVIPAPPPSFGSGEVYLGPPYFNSDGAFILNMSAPISNNSETIGLLLAAINATDLERIIYSTTGLQTSGEVIGGYPNADNTRIIFLVPPRLDPSYSSTGITSPIGLASKGLTGFKSARDYRNHKVTAAYTPVNYSNWGLQAKEDEAESYHPVHNIEVVIIISIVCILLGGLLFAYLISRVFSRPIILLSKTAAALGRGNMRARASRKQGFWEDELDTLRHTFNHMADELASSYVNLEIKVRERTSELAIANQVLALEVQERKKVQVELEMARNVAVEADKMKSEWLANMSHEIRTPLNGVINCTELCLDTSITEEQHEYLELSLFSAKHLLRLITDILDFSKIEAGKMSMESVEFSLHDQMEHAVAVLAARAHKKGLELTCHAMDGVPDILVGDPGRIFQIFINLLGNSIKFTDKGEVVLVASLRGNPAPGRVELLFSVKDTGIGIPKKKQSLLFQAFQQVESSTQRLYGGTGLGLVISSKLASAMEGAMWVDSDEGKGSTFSFTAQLTLPPSPVRTQGLLSSTSLTVMQAVKALVVESNDYTRGVLVELLQRWVAAAEGVKDGAAAIEALENEETKGQPFQLMLLDLHLPEDGLDKPDADQLLAILRSRPTLLPDVRPPKRLTKIAAGPAGGGSGDGNGAGWGRDSVSVWMDADREVPSMGSAEEEQQGRGLEKQESGSTIGSLEGLQAGEIDMDLEVPAWLRNKPTVESASSRDWPSPKTILRTRRPPRYTAGGSSPRRTDSSGRWLPVVMLTTSDHAEAARCREMGIEAVAPKPVKRTILLRAIQTALQLPQGSPSEPPSPSHSQKAQQHKGLHILVAEDNVINQRVALTLLHKWGHTTMLASTGAEAVELHLSTTFDLILMDVQMPVLDGIEATVRIRELEHSQGRHTPIVAMTAHAMHGDGARCLAAGMDNYIAKPLNSAKLQELLRLAAENRLPTPTVDIVHLDM